MPDLMSRWSQQTPEQILAKATQHLPFWVSLTFVILIGYYLARIAWLLYPAADETAWSPPPPLNSPAGQPAADAAFQTIVAAHLFGTTDANAVPAVVEETDDAPDTRLNLKLRATVAATDQTVAHAIIADNAGKEKVYFVRDSIPGGATLHRVHADRVILNRGGVLEALRLPREFDGSTGTGIRRSAAPARQANVQQLITENAANFTEIIRPQPFMPNGQLKGYRVFPGRNRQQFIALGLRPGDLVTAINGMALNNPAEGMEIFRTLADSSQVAVTIERNGQQQSLTLDASKLAELGNKRR